MEFPPLIRAMLTPSFYPHRPGAVVLMQTHISWVFLAGELVYKVKKPVNLGFLDYTTLPRRASFCRRELELNRRLARGLYRAVVPLRQEGGRYHPGGGGRLVDWAVVMRRIPDRALLSHHLEDGRVTAAMMRGLARTLSAFHRRVAGGPAVARYGSHAVLRRNNEEDFAQTKRYIGRTISRRNYELVAGYARVFLERHRLLLRRRVAEGRIKDGHGDLHAEHIGWRHGRPFAFDCIEFTPRFRCADVAAEVAFLAMDLEERGAWPLAQAFLEEYLTASRDEEIRALLDFYLCYRAWVRGKVNSFMTDDPRESAAERQRARGAAARYFRFATAYARRDRAPLLVVMTGLTGTGKSTVADLLADRLGFVVLRSDELRKKLAGLSPGRRSPEVYQRGLYDPAMTARTYRALLEAGREILADGRPVVLDATFNRAGDREAAQRLAARTGARFRLVETTCDEILAQRRLRTRWERGVSASEGRWEIYLAQRRDREPPREMVRVDTGTPTPAFWRRLLGGLYPLKPVALG